MVLDILVPQYEEAEDEVRDLLTSLASQHRADMSGVRVLIGNDGSRVKLSDGFLNSFPYTVKYLQFPHSGVSGTRQKLLEAAEADYVMFCDADDMFMSNLGLRVVMDYIGKGFDVLASLFLEEQPRDGKFVYLPHEKDHVFVHGKAFRRAFLMERGIRWHEDLHYHEDSCFVIRAIANAGRFEYCTFPFYLWKWNDSSVCRRDKKYILKTYTHMIASTDHLAEDLVSDGKPQEAGRFVAGMVYNMYFVSCQPDWLDPVNRSYREKTEDCFRVFYEKNMRLFRMLSQREHEKVLKGIRMREAAQRVTFEPYTFDAWLRHIRTGEKT